ncbi:Rha family transcriptional regulator [Intestinibacter bartlettii]|uniref:Rha family transcriptional regulator n=1 Tax=Intestinibacter bartlettii TaxID=261299 RepID=UPI0039928A94
MINYSSRCYKRLETNTNSPYFFRLTNFGESSYRNSQNRKQPMYYMTRDGFTFY